jgi:Dolichyl-phosphate-mannose-protein mannosyltransferase
VTARPAFTPPTALRWLPAALLLAALVVHLPTLGAPLVERHAFRQTQTAFTARIYHEQGIDLLHPMLPVFGPPWEVPFEFPLFQAVAAGVMDVGVPEDAALRLTGLASFILAGGLLWVLVRRQVGWLGATVALGLFLFSPLGISWGRAALIEYLALAASIAFALTGMRWREGGSGWWFAMALVLGCIATLVKITTAIFWVAPFALLALRRDDDQQTRRVWAGAWVLAIAPVLAGLAWTRYTDAIKAASDATAWLVSSRLIDWTFGSVAQRLDPGPWTSIYTNVGLLAGGIALPLLIYPAIRFALASRQVRFWSWIAITAAGPILVFFNLYVVHDYYSIAASGSIAALVGVGVAGLSLVRAWLRGLLLLGATLAWAGVWFMQMPYWTPMYERATDPEGILPLAAQIQRETSPDQRVAIVGRDWTPAILYYADRWGWMVTERESPPVDLAALEAAGFVIYRCPGGAGSMMCIRLTHPALGVPVPSATFGPVTGRTGLLESGS